MKESALSNRLRALREEADYTQEDVSRQLHVRRQTYSNYETERRTPSIDTIVALAELYHVSVDYLINKTDVFTRQHLTSSQKKAGEKLLNEFYALSAHKQKEVFEFIRFKKHLPD